MYYIYTCVVVGYLLLRVQVNFKKFFFAKVSSSFAVENDLESSTKITDSEYCNKDERIEFNNTNNRKTTLGK